MPVNSRTKGANFERKIVRELRAHFGWAEDVCYRGAPMQASRQTILPDVEVPVPLWLELGHGKAMDPVAKLKQADRDRKPDTYPAAITRRDHGPIQVTMYAWDVARMMGPFTPCGAVTNIPITMSWESFLGLIEETL